MNKHGIEDRKPLSVAHSWYFICQCDHLINDIVSITGWTFRSLDDTGYINYVTTDVFGLIDLESRMAIRKSLDLSSSS